MLSVMDYVMRLIRGALNMMTIVKANTDLNKKTPQLLTVNELTIATKAGVVLVDKLSYQLKQGATLAIVGESGSGKSIASLALLGTTM